MANCSFNWPMPLS